ncbi:RNA-binding protein [Bacillus sp. ISL-47]|uniref:YlmH family RNA-binding protein n=1 Tax=Bacillus sp. ISL-47 TaxID=2819130 RepID=UPI001BECAAE0|nr:RNA-binding protein [Bacillus sp. ISL-47]MBT2687956.1 RNA-binding protein [Bacillus sp. ISL-47]MBT2708224.1 RNA-binding protein [Pseudomonas sp. ISL-84]
MSIYQHFRPEEKEFIDQVLNWKDQAENTYAPKLTDFLDPREQHILKSIIGQHSGIQCDLFGGIPNSERKRALIFPDYYQPDEEDFQICLFEVDYPKKFVTLEHPQVLGSLMSLGLKRGKFGDILFDNDRIQFFVSEEVEDYIRLQLETIGRASVTLRKQPFAKTIQTSEEWREYSVTSSSLRLDTVISAVYSISRQKSQLFIQQGLVKVNWTLLENPSFECKEGDMISVRGQGRSKIMEIEGKTKKDKWRIIAGRQK